MAALVFVNRTMAEMNQCFFSGLLRRLSASRRLRDRTIALALKLEGGQFYSETARWIMKEKFGVVIGDYSYGDCFEPGIFPANVTIGRYVSIGPGVRVFLRNHPMDWLSMHPFFYNRSLGFVENDTITTSSLTIGHDAWIGAGAMVMPGCTKIGLGAVVGAGAIVTKDVPDFAIVAGNPARLIRMRFPENLCHCIRESHWWEKSATECIRHMPEMIIPLGENHQKHPLLHSGHGMPPCVM